MSWKEIVKESRLEKVRGWFFNESLRDERQERNR